MKSVSILIISVVAAIALVGGLFLFGKPEQKVDLPVTVKEYSDFNCPHCRDFHPTSIQLRELYKDNPDVKFEFISNPILGSSSQQAAFAAEAAKNQDKFHEYVDLLYTNFDKREDKDYESFATELKLDVEKFNKDREDSALQKRVLDQTDKNRDEGITSTPTIVINGKKAVTQDYNELTKKISDLIELGKKQQKK